MDDKIVAWALVANGAAMLLCFNAILDRKICNIDFAVVHLLIFFLGIALAVFRVVLSQAVAERTHLMLRSFGSDIHHFLVKYTRAGTEEERATVSADTNERIAGTLSRGRGLVAMERVASIALAGSFICFGGALLYAVTSNSLQASLCPS